MVKRIHLSPNGDYSGEIWNAKRLVEFREALELSVANLAEAARISESTLVAIEKGAEEFCEPLRSRVWRVIDRKFNARAEREAQRNPMSQEVLSNPSELFNRLFPKRK